MKPLCIDLFAGLGGWAEGFIAEGFRVVGFDVERHQYGDQKYPAQLVIQDVLALRGSQFRDAAVIVASPPCQAYSYRAMPWKRAKALPPPSNELFDACFRIQREASESAGRYVPLVVENVKGAQPWVGRARWHYGSFYLWGDVPALMPTTASIKNTGGSWFAIANNTTSGHGQNPDGRNLGLKWGDCNGKRFDKRPKGNVAAHREGTKLNGPIRQGELKPGEFGWHKTIMADGTSKSPARKAASAQIAKIPFPLSQHIAKCFKP